MGFNDPSLRDCRYRSTAYGTVTARLSIPWTAEATDGESEAAPEPSRAVTIHVPGDDLGREGATETAEEAPAPEPEAAAEPTTTEAEPEAGEAPKAKKKTRRGSRGGRNRKKKPAGASQNGAEAAAEGEAAPEAEESASNGEFEYVPMSEWGDELEAKG